MDAAALRDHLPEILAFISSDLRTAQTDEQQRTKSEGQSHDPNGKSAAGLHGRLRAKSGFNVEQMVGEYRALRASILRLWSAQGPADESALQEMTRFNEAVDQAIAESVAHFSSEAEAWRHVFLGVLGHDLRGPLSVIMLTSEIMSKMAADTPYSKQADHLIKSGRRMSELLDDLLDYSRTALGMGIRIARSEGDLASAVQDELEQLRIAFPDHRIVLELSGSTTGEFDFSRVREALANLVANAAKYGSPGGAIQVRLHGDADGVQMIVENEGVALSPDAMHTMFEPLKRGSMDDEFSRHSLGLGLFIVREIAKAHGGDVTVSSSERTTRFSLHLTRTDAEAPTQL
jgi:signal transduction histidine kinase